MRSFENQPMQENVYNTVSIVNDEALICYQITAALMTLVASPATTFTVYVLLSCSKNLLGKEIGAESSKTE